MEHRGTQRMPGGGASGLRRSDDLVSTPTETLDQWSAGWTVPDSVNERRLDRVLRRGRGRTHRRRREVTAKVSVNQEPALAHSRTRGSAVPAPHGTHSALSYPPSFAQAGSRLLGCRRRNCVRPSSTSDSAQSSTITGWSETSSRWVPLEALSTVFIGLDTPILRSAQATTVPRRDTETMAIGRRPPSSRSEAGVNQRLAASSELHTYDT